MTTNRDRLDEAIDIIAARMTNVEKDAALAARIASALRERSNWSPRVWMTRLAVGALATLAIVVVLRTFEEGSADVQTGVQADVQTIVQTGVRTGVHAEAPASARKTTALNPRENDRLNAADHERSLAPIEAVAALTVDALTPIDLASEPVQEIAPLVLADLPLSFDFSPR